MADAAAQGLDANSGDEVSLGGDAATGSGPKPSHPCKVFSCSADVGVSIEATVWGKEIMIGDRAVTVHSATIRKSFMRDDGTYGNTNFLRGVEIPVAVHVLQLAASWIMTQRTRENPPS